MKHPFLSGLKKEITNIIEGGFSASVSCDCLSLSPFIFKDLPFKKIFILNSPDFNEALSYFDVNKRSFAALPSRDGFLAAEGFSSFNKQLLNLGKHRCSVGWSGVDLCLVDQKSLHASLLYGGLEDPGLSLDDSGSMESFLEKISKIGYSKKNTIIDQGDYVVKGGCVDVFSYGAMSPVRVSFLDEKIKAYSIEKEDGFVLDLVKNVFFPPKKTKKETSIYKKGVLEKSVFISYTNNKLIFNSLSKKPTKRISFYKGLVDYAVYKKNREKECFYSPLLQKKGFSIDKNTLFVPLWYKGGLSTADPTPYVSKMVPGYKYIHENFGVCRFVGVETSVDNVDKICLEFEDGKIKINVSLVGSLFYLGDEKNKQPLSFMSRRGSWGRTKRKYSLLAQEFVEGVYLVYNKRKTTTRSSYSSNRELDLLFNQTFPHKATEGQKECVNDIFSDFSTEFPMTRLLCGDVGFGKTEVALRSVFRVSYNKKRSVVVAPTKILKDQIFSVFEKRFSPFGIPVFSSISSFLNNKDPGSVLISSHKVLNRRSVLVLCSFLIVDEEHRFGVLQKENIILQNPEADVLYMSATPLPRSLQMSISKARPISIIKTPPLAKKQIMTHVYRFNNALIRSVISNEISRSGQVFVVDKSVVFVRRLHKLIVSQFPEVSSAVVYSSLPAVKIQKTMESFRNNKIKILISTTIIESGIDVGNANTIIINNADFFGLSQLYQMRGRVGRGSSQAHAYLLLSEKQTSSAVSRLKSLVKHQSLGSGYNIAFDDLKIRGAGSVFGYKQSGGGGVGFEFYSKLVGDALGLLNHENKEKTPLVALGEGFIPPAVIPSSADRVRAYKTVADCQSVALLLSFYSRFVSFLGKDCFSFYCLIKNRQIQLLLQKTCVESIVLSGSFLIIKINKNSFYYNKAFLFSMNSFFKKRKINTIKKTDSLEYKIQFKKTVKDCYIFIINLLEFLDGKK